MRDASPVCRDLSAFTCASVSPATFCTMASGAISAAKATPDRNKPASTATPEPMREREKMCFIMNSFLHIYVANGAGNAHAIQVVCVKRQEGSTGGQDTTVKYMPVAHQIPDRREPLPSASRDSLPAPVTVFRIIMAQPANSGESDRKH